MSDGAAAAAAAATLSLVQACETIRDLHQVHGHMIKTNQPDHRQRSSVLSGRLVAATCSLSRRQPLQNQHMDYALSVFSRIPSPDTFTHNAVIHAFLCASSPHLSLLFFSSNLHNFRPNSHTLPLLLKSAALIRSLPAGAAFHALLIKLRLPSQIHTHTALLSLYSSCGDLTSAHGLFSASPHLTQIATWNAVISGSVKGGHPKEALNFFHRLLKTANAIPNEITVVSALAACTALGALDTAKWIHGHAVKFKIPLNVSVGTALVDAYAKCGSIELARKVFDEMPHRNVVSWTAMIQGLAMFGNGEDALALFSDMVALGVTPDDITFVGLLSACSHSGLVDEGRCIFNSMAERFNVSPKAEHYGCMVDLFSRAGQLDDALGLIETMPIDPEAALWGSLLSACRRSPTNLKLAEYVANRMIEIEPNNDATYVLLSNIYALNDRWDDAARVRTLMKTRGISKTPGCSSVEVGGVVHEFTVGDRSHPCAEEIHAMVKEIESRVRELGYVMDTSEVLLDIGEHEKRSALLLHSEKLALAFGLIGTGSASPVRIVKNIRVCGDCHLVMKLASRAFRREIILRDRNRFHRFKEGSCTCDDFW